MNRLIRPLSEEFLYCSPESLERRLFRLMVPGAPEPEKEKRDTGPKEKRHVTSKEH